jgi:carbon monoxide dehydrogenase subunit G
VPTSAFERDIEVQADRDRCWSVLTDVPRLIDWVSIVSDATEIAPLEKYTAVLTDRLGQFKLSADLAIEVSEIVPGEHIRVRASGEDRQVSSRIGVDAVLLIGELPGGGSRVGVTGSYEVVGKVATMGAGMIRQKAAKVIDEFFAHATAALGAR